MSKILEFLKNKGIKHLCLYFFIYITLLQTFTARWVVSYLEIPSTVTKIITLLLYLPLLVFVLWKLVCDVLKKKITAFNIAYYGFAVYYFCLTVVRYFTNAEIKENLYYTLILIGSVALFDLIKSKYINVDKKDISNDILFFSLFMLLYRLIHVVWLKQYIYYSAINEIAICGCLVILFPIIVKKMVDSDKKTVWPWLCALSVFGMVSVLLTLQSRVGFWVLVVECIALLVYVLVKRKKVVHFLAALLAAVSLISVLFVADVGEVRYAIYRETGIVMETPDTPDTPDDAPPSSTPNVQQQAGAQIQRSDFMREELFALALEEVKANPLFGTGNLFHTYNVEGEIFEVPAHNFVLTTLNCYGIIGFLLVAAIMCIALWQMGIFDLRNKKGKWEYLFLILLTLALYFGVGLVQATVYDFQVMPIMFVILGAFSMFLEEKKTEKVQENDQG